MHVTEQPPFLNAAALVDTDLSAPKLLAAVKSLEASAGRDFAGPRWGPRPLDIDLIFHGAGPYQTDALTVPHERWQERPFVVVPVSELLHNEHDNETLQVRDHVQAASFNDLAQLDVSNARDMSVQSRFWCARTLEMQVQADLILAASLAARGAGEGDMQQQWVLAHGVRLAVRHRTLVMGILNVTPDSFSDGGLHLDTCAADASCFEADVSDEHAPALRDAWRETGTCACRFRRSADGCAAVALCMLPTCV